MTAKTIITSDGLDEVPLPKKFQENIQESPSCDGKENNFFLKESLKMRKINFNRNLRDSRI